MKKFNVLFYLSMLLCLTTQAQMEKWCIPPYLVDLSGPPPTPTIATSSLSAGSYLTSANAAFDKTGNMLFYVRSGEIVTPAGAVVNAFPVPLSLEISIVPVPSHCSRYYVIAIGYDVSGGPVDLYYTMVETAGGISVVTGFNNVNLGVVGNGKAGLAVSRLRADRTRYLFTVGGSAVQRFRITDSGINLEDGLMHNISGLGNNQAVDVELKENIATGTMKLAWGQTTWTVGTPNYVHVLNLTSLGGPILPLNNYAIPGLRGVYGLEFYGYSGTHLAVGQTSSTDGIALIDLSTSTVSVLPSSSSYAGSQIETAPNGRIYVLGSSKELAIIDPGAGTITNTSLILSSYSGIFENTLPEQINDEDYITANFRAQLMARDNYSDVGAEPFEPTPPTDFVSSPDLWNRRDSLGDSLVHQNPGYASTTFGNLMKMRVTNIGCMPSTTSYVKMYWTLASTGESWPGSWTGAVMYGTQPAGGQLTLSSAYSTYTSGQGYAVPALNPGQSAIISAKWFPPSPTSFPSGTVSDPVNICFLGRIVDPLQDPMYSELPVAASINHNVTFNNNIVTRNTYLANLPGNFKVAQAPREISLLVQNYLSSTQLFNINFAALLQSDLAFANLGTITLKVDNALWSAWVQGGQQASGLTVSNQQTHEFTVTNLSNAVLYNVSMNANDAMLVTLGFVLNNPTLTTNTYRFGITQERSDWQQGEERYGSPCTFIVDIVQDSTGGGQDSSHMKKQTSTGVQSIEVEQALSQKLIVYPNPSANEAIVKLELAEQESVLSVKITDISGKLIKQITDTKTDKTRGDQSIHIITSELPNGVYIVSVQTTEGLHSAKMNVAH